MMDDFDTMVCGCICTFKMQIVFIVLKLFKVISWSWLSVMIPTFVGIGTLLIALIIEAIGLAFTEDKEK